MRFLADESCDFAVVRALRAAGHDVRAVADGSAGVDDDIVLDAAIQDDRVLLTEDKDFGQLFYANARPSGSVILMRFPARVRTGLPPAVVELIGQQGERLPGCFVVMQPGRTRINRTPEP
jgi:hypothetical protein